MSDKREKEIQGLTNAGRDDDGVWIRKLKIISLSIVFTVILLPENYYEYIPFVTNINYFRMDMNVFPLIDRMSAMSPFPLFLENTFSMFICTIPLIAIILLPRNVCETCVDFYNKCKNEPARLFFAYSIVLVVALVLVIFALSPLGTPGPPASKGAWMIYFAANNKISLALYIAFIVVSLGLLSTGIILSLLLPFCVARKPFR